MIANLDQKGGLQNRYLTLAKNLSAGREVTIITWRARGQANPDIQGIRVIRVPSLVPFHREAPPLLAQLNVAFSVASAVLAAFWIRRRWSAVLAGGLNPEGLAAAILGRTLGRSFVLDTWLPGPLGNVARLERSRLAKMHKWLLSAASALTPGTEEVAQEMANAGFPASRIKMIRKGIDLDLWAPVGNVERIGARRRLGLDPAVKVLAYWGRFDLRQKRVDLLLDAWKLSEVRGWELVLVGDGPDRAAVEERAGDIEPPVRVLGWQEDATSIPHAADGFVLPTEFEETGIALLEGLTSGLPGLLSRTSMYERLQPAGVVLVDNTVQAWREAIRFITQADDVERRSLGAEGRAWAVSYGSSTELAAAFEKLLFPEESAEKEVPEGGR
jgi:glycosyltransferase involved in cell wall biosynthesis